MLAIRIKSIIGCLLLLLCAGLVHAQEENNHWYFGGNAGMNFVITPATMPGQQTTYTTPLPDGKIRGTVRPAVLSDSLGQLVLYSDGKKIWDRNHQLIPGADDLMGSGIDAETLIIPGKCGQFYLLYNQVTTNSNNLYYSLIDTSLNNGLGGIVPGQKNILLLPSGRHIAFNAIRSYGKYFLVIYQSDFNGRGRFLSYEMNANGQLPTPVISQTAAMDHWYMSMSIRVSPNGTDLCLIKRNTTLNLAPAELFRINLQGQVSRTTTLYPMVRFQGYVTAIHEGAFSPDGTKFYTLERSTSFISPGTADVSTRFSQYEIARDMDSVLILNSRTTIHETPNTTNKIGRMGNMEIGKHGKIYIGQYLDDKLSVIDRPNLKGTACKFLLNTVPLAGGTQGYERLPNALFAHYRVRPWEQEYRLRDTTFICDGDVISLSVDPSYDSQRWSDGSTGRTLDITQPGDYTVTVTKGGCTHQQHLFVDGTLKQDIVPEDEFISCNAAPVFFDVTDTAANAYLWSDGVTNPVRSLTEGGTYWVERTFDNCVYRDEFEIIAQPLVEDFWPEDTSVCVDTYFFLSANTFRGTYEWNTGETSPNILVNEPGLYWVNIDALGCKASDTIRVIHQLPPQPQLRDTVVCKGYPLS
ncbi:MAG: hypothetical protein AAFR61_10690, partial [Bacteroidota bacterium]